MSNAGKGGPLVIRLKRDHLGTFSVALGSGLKKPKIAKAKNKVRKPREQLFAVTSIRFNGSLDLHYARVPVGGLGHPTFLRPHPHAARHHYNPPVVCPAALDPHWDAHRSWPAVYVRDGAAGGPHPRGLVVNFSCLRPLHFNGQRDIRAAGPNGIATNVVTVNFVNGVAANVAFTFATLPNTVGCFSGIGLDWESRPAGAGAWREIGETRHTLYMLDAIPRAALGANEQHYFDVVDWSCRWAHGQQGPANVLAQILAQFQPVAANHASGLIYWRNHQSLVPPAQSVATAIQYQDFGIGERKASSCKVFDYLFLNCLSVHGIQAAEIMLRPMQFLTPLQPAMGGLTGFQSITTGGWYGSPTSWSATTVVAHGNAVAPAAWQSHWIAAVNTAAGWMLYDPSYGLGPYAMGGAPAALALIPIPAAYEVAAVLSFPCSLWSADGVNIAAPGIVHPLPPVSPLAPYLYGTVLTAN